VPLERIQFETIGPLRFVSGLWRDEGKQPMLAVPATKVGATPIRGYVFTASLIDPTAGNRLRRVTTKALKTQTRTTISSPERPGVPEHGSSRICPTGLSPATP
jgi:hypothetical protein